MNLKILDDYVERGLLRKAEDDDLVQYNYSEEVNTSPMGELWDDITMFNRGNIYEKRTGELIARAMPKFMNFEQYSTDKQKQILSNNNINVTEKMDGCLGILYMYKGKIRCNSRGSFDNYVTDKMKELLPKYVMLRHILKFNTLNVEVISPKTKIICDYGDKEELYLITAYSKNPEIGEFNYKTLNLMSKIIRMPIVKEYNMSWEELLNWKNTSDYSQEGFVVRINNDRIKVKSNDYLRIAKLKCGLTKHRIWRLYKNDLEQGTNSLTPYMENVPDELSNTAKNWYDEITCALNKLKEQARIEYNKVKGLDKKTIGITLKDNKYIHAIFAIINGKEEILNKLFIKWVEPEDDLEELKLVEE